MCRPVTLASGRPGTANDYGLPRPGRLHFRIKHRNGGRQVDCPGRHWGRCNLPSTSPVTSRAVILTTFPFQCVRTIIEVRTLRTPNDGFTVAPNSRGTWDWLTTKNGQIHGYSVVGRQCRMFLLRYSPEGRKLLLNTRINSGLLAIEIDKLHDRFWRLKRSWSLSISMASDPTRSSILLSSQVFAGRS